MRCRCSTRRVRRSPVDEHPQCLFWCPALRLGGEQQLGGVAAYRRQLRAFETGLEIVGQRRRCRAGVMRGRDPVGVERTHLDGRELDHDGVPASAGSSRAGPIARIEPRRSLEPSEACCPGQRLVDCRRGRGPGGDRRRSRDLLGQRRDTGRGAGTDERFGRFAEREECPLDAAARPRSHVTVPGVVSGSAHRALTPHQRRAAGAARPARRRSRRCTGRRR